MDKQYILPTRLLDMEWAVEGFKRSGVPLIAYKDGHYLQAGSVGDDPGTALFIPLVAHYLDLPFDEAYPLFYTFCLYSSFLIGALGFWYVFKSNFAKTAAISILGYYCWDNLSMHPEVYLVPALLTLATIPWLLHWAPQKPSKTQVAFFFLTGFACGMANFLRLYSGIGVLLCSFFGILLWNSHSLKLKSRPLLGLAAGFMACFLLIQGLYHQRDQFLIANNIEPTNISDGHLFWTAIYLGLGFVNNDLGFKYKDSVAIDKVEELFPGTEYASREFDNILKEQLIRLWKKGYIIIYYSFAAKFGVIFFYFLLYSNVGCLSHYLIRKPFKYHFPFFIALGFLGAPPLLAIPRENYLFGFIMFSMIYGFIGLEEASKHNFFLDSAKKLIPGRTH